MSKKDLIWGRGSSRRTITTATTTTRISLFSGSSPFIPSSLGRVFRDTSANTSSVTKTSSSTRNFIAERGLGRGGDVSTNNKNNLFTYQLGQSLYIPLTSECNSNSLPLTRGGERFLQTLPDDVLISLILVRLAEQKQVDSSKELELAATSSADDNDNEHENALDRAISTLFAIDCDPPAGITKASTSNHDSFDVSIFKERVQNLLSTHCLMCSNSNLNHNDSFYPKIDTLYNEVMHNLSGYDTGRDDGNGIKSIVFAGEGEPTLRLNAICAISSLIQNVTRNQMPIRVLTNGLVYYSMHYKKHNIRNDDTSFSNMNNNCLQQMKDAGINALSITLPTSCPNQYMELMKPLKHFHHDGKYTPNMEEDVDDDIKLTAHESVCQFVADAIQLEFDVEVTGVDRDFVDKEKTEQLAAYLGVTKPFRWRSYF